MVVPSAFKSFTGASDIFHCFFVRYYSGFVNNHFIRLLLFKGQEFLDQQLQVWMTLVFFFFIKNVVYSAFVL